MPDPTVHAQRDLADVLRREARQRLLVAMGPEVGASLTDYDRRIVAWLSGHDGQTVDAIASWLDRAREAGRREVAREPWPAPGTDEDDLIHPHRDDPENDGMPVPDHVDGWSVGGGTR
jgi:hypothetical protein